MTKVFVSVTMSLDGFVAPPGRMEQLQGPAFDVWVKEWSKLQDHLFHQEFFRRNLHFPGEGEKGPDDAWLRAVFERTGVSILGKRMFDAGEATWPEDAPFHTPVFVLTHENRASWPRPGGTIFHFVNDGPASALARARAACPPGKDIRIGGGGDTVSQFLRAGLVEELHIAVAPVTLGRGVRMLDGLPFGSLELEVLPAPASSRVTHLRYAVRPGKGGHKAES